MTFKDYIVEKLKNKKTIKKILFIDGDDTRAQSAAMLHKTDGIIEPILLVNTRSEAGETSAQVIAVDEIQDREEELIAKYVERRKGKESEEDAKKVIFTKPILATLLLELGEVDGVVGGLINASADIMRAAFKVIGPKEGIKTISSVMLMERAHEWYIFTDISVIPEPTVEQLSDIAKNASSFAGAIDFKTKVAFLSFSTSGSAAHPRAMHVKEATDKFNKESNPEYKAIGEVQFDAAFSPEIRKMKYKDEGFLKNPTIFVFPSLEAGNIGYKIAQRMGGFGAIGPIITGINKPINDLSRGSKMIDVYNTAIITAVQVEE